MGLHDRIMSQMAAPLHFSSEIGTSSSVVIHRPGKPDETRELIVQLPINFGDNVQGDSQVVSGQVLFPAADSGLAKAQYTLTIRGELFQIRSVGTVVDGFIPVSVTRRRHETQTASSSLGGI